jgi:hypothetical protein
MRGRDRESGKLFSYASLESLIPQDHPLRPIRGADTIARTAPEPTVPGLARGLVLSPQIVARLVEGWRKAGLPQN